MENKSKSYRDYLGWLIVGLSFGIIILIVVQTLCKLTGDSKEILVGIQSLTSIILPLIGSWVGAVIAYYFGKESLEAANKNVQSLVDKINPMDKLKNIKVLDIMIPLSSMKKYQIPNGIDFKAILLIDLLDFCNFNKVSRIPMIRSNNVLEVLIHRSMIDLLISRHSLNADLGKEIKKLNVQDLLSNEETKKYINTTLSINEEATVFDAKSAFDNEPNASDVFVTKSGSIKDPILGMLTEAEIIKHLKN